MEPEILARLSNLENEEGVKIVYACESGSRAWGFPSSDSDYDVRFLYVRPKDWYLSIDLEKRRDVIERPITDHIDLNGWDVRKALWLYRKSNPPLWEWLGSPTIYLEKYAIAAQMRKLGPEYYSPKACLYHYLHMARGNYRESLQGERVWIKKYFYILRPLLAINWLEKDLGIVPTEFKALVNQVIGAGELKQASEKLLQTKAQGEELGYGPRIPAIGDFIDKEMTRLAEKQFTEDTEKKSSEELNRLFRSALDEVWS